MRKSIIPVCLLTAAWLGGCASPSINLATSEPIKVDITMRVDVHQFQETGSPAATNGSAAATMPSIQENDPALSREARRKNRQADIQIFKNSRLIGEGKDGLLKVLAEPEGDYGDYIRRSVERENADRMDEMKQLAEKAKRPLAEVQTEQAALWISRSFKGEWIEVKKPDATYSWIQKAG
jgi:uncharacterized protein YdbL (DUF1318 family)